MDKPSNRSKVWEFFSVNSDIVICNICKSTISQSSDKGKKKNTSNLWSHLQSKHEDQYKKISSLKSSKKQTHDEMNQKKLVQLFDRVKKCGNTDTRSKTTDKMIVDMTAMDNLPFSVAENVSFQCLVSNLEPCIRSSQKNIIEQNSFLRHINKYAVK